MEQFIAPGGPGVRLDTYMHAGGRISPRYDSLIAKLIVHRETRGEAIETMRRALGEFRIGPIRTTIPLHLRIMQNRTFQSGRFDTGFLDRDLAQ